ncbi:MAG: protein arginine kinase [Planctomycetota bacterium]
MQLSDFKNRAGEWLSGTGPDSDLVISSRIRLARNLEDHLFLSRANAAKRAAVRKEVRSAIDEVGPELDLSFVNIQKLHSIDRCVLVERHLISREHAFAKGDRGVAFNGSEGTAIMVNEEDHLRLQVMRSGFQLSETWTVMNELDSKLERHLSYAFDPHFGYLTVCPTNVGTGLRASVMLHLPALVMTRQIEKVFQAVGKLNLAVRGLYGEGTEALGDFYQISNQVTLGKSEEDIISNIRDVLPQIMDYERKVRSALLQNKREVLEDKIWRAYGTLCSARIISSKETLEALSLVRMGVNLKILVQLTLKQVNELFLLTQPGHLQKMEGAELETSDRDVARARFIRSYLEANCP